MVGGSAGKNERSPYSFGFINSRGNGSLMTIYERLRLN
jgi:hypothetical protein